MVREIESRWTYYLIERSDGTLQERVVLFGLQAKNRHVIDMPHKLAKDAGVVYLELRVGADTDWLEQEATRALGPLSGFA